MAKMDEADRQTCIQLQRYGLNPAVASGLVAVGVHSAGQLGEEDPVLLHRRLKLLGHNEPSLLHDLAAAIHATRTGHWETSWV